MTGCPCFFRLVGRETNGDDFRFGEDDGGHGNRVVGSLVARNEFSHHFALEGGHVRQHFAGVAEVADGVNAFHVGLASLVDFDKSAVVHGNARCFKTRGGGLATDGDEHLVGNDVLHLFLVVFRFIDEIEFDLPAFGVLNTFCKHTGVDLDFVFLEEQLQGPTQFFVEQRQHRIHGFHDGDFRAEHAVGDAQFQSDVPLRRPQRCGRAGLRGKALLAKRARAR